MQERKVHIIFVDIGEEAEIQKSVQVSPGRKALSQKHLIQSQNGNDPLAEIGFSPFPVSASATAAAAPVFLLVRVLPRLVLID